jgi:hypothetical protein
MHRGRYSPVRGDAVICVDSPRRQAKLRCMRFRIRDINLADIWKSFGAGSRNRHWKLAVGIHGLSEYNPKAV